MRAQRRIVHAFLAIAACLLTASCSDFFEDSKTAPKTNGGTVPGGQGGSVSEEFQKPNEGPFSEQRMLINIGVNVLARAADDLHTQVPVLKNSVRQYCEALASGSTALREEKQAQMDWERVMLSFHVLQAAPVGPLMDNGRYLNDYLYSWPYLNTCDIDKKVFENTRSAVSPDALLFNVRGLSAIEYLLFEKSLKSTCNLRANPAMAEWNARTEQQKKLDRCMWAQELVKDMQNKSATLQKNWAMDGGNFTKALIDGSRYSSLKESINALTDALANIEKVKDAKLGKPLARHKDCLEDKCARDVEHIYSGLSLGAVEAQLKGFKAVFTGSFTTQNAYGLDDLLVQSGRGDVAEKMVRAIDQALLSVRAAQEKGSLFEQIEAMNPTLCKSTTMTDRKEEICAVHADIREVAFLLKTEVLAALALRAPPTHQGDND